MHHCTNCVGLYRCIHCGKISQSSQFKTHSGRKDGSLLRFSDGERMRIAICYQCDFQKNKERYTRYDRRILSTSTIEAFVSNNLQRWRSKTPGTPINRDFLIALWHEQNGCCYYTGRPLSTSRGKGEWGSLSLDRLDPNKGYIPGNVVWTSRLVNTSKGSRTKQEFIAFCFDVVSHNGLMANEDTDEQDNED